MSFTSKVRNGVIVVPPDVQLPEGTEVTVTPRVPAESPEFLRRVLRLAKPRDWPADYALNHGHYAKGEPKK